MRLRHYHLIYCMMMLCPLVAGSSIVAPHADDQASHPQFALRTIVVELPDDRRSMDGVIQITLLRSLEWINDVDARVGHQIKLELHEMDLAGSASVLAIAPCPVISDAPGRVVTATFGSVSNDVHELRFDNSDTTVRATGAHPLYSIDRGTWVRVDELRDDEQLRTAQTTGHQTLGSMRHLDGAHSVYNLEVSREHDYWITKHELLVHNTYAIAKRVKHAVARTLFPNKHRAKRREWYKKTLPYARSKRVHDPARTISGGSLVDARNGDRIVLDGVPIVGGKTAGTLDVDFRVTFSSHGKVPVGQPFERAIHIDVLQLELHWPHARFDAVYDEDVPQLIAEQLAAQLQNQITARGARKGLAYKKLTIHVPIGSHVTKHKELWAVVVPPRIMEFALPYPH